MEHITLYPAPKSNDGTNKKEWTPLEPLKPGEYDLVNISMIGFDPNSGWTYEQCSSAWKSACEGLMEENKNTPWWNFKRRFALVRRIAILSQRQGMGN